MGNPIHNYTTADLMKMSAKEEANLTRGLSREEADAWDRQLLDNDKLANLKEYLTNGARLADGTRVNLDMQQTTTTLTPRDYAQVLGFTRREGDEGQRWLLLSNLGNLTREDLDRNFGYEKGYIDAYSKLFDDGNTYVPYSEANLDRLKSNKWTHYSTKKVTKPGMVLNSLADMDINKFAQRVNMSVDDLRRLNPNLKGNTIKAGTNITTYKVDEDKLKQDNDEAERRALEETRRREILLRNAWIALNGKAARLAAFWQGRDPNMSDEELYNSANDIINLQNLELSRRKENTERRKQALNDHADEIKRNGPNGLYSTEAIYARQRAEHLLNHGSNGIFSRGLTLNGNTNFGNAEVYTDPNGHRHVMNLDSDGYKSGILNFLDQLKLGEQVVDLTKKGAGLAVGLAGGASLGTANAVNGITKLVPGLALSYGANKGLDYIGKNDPNSWANNRYIRAGANALAFGTGSGLVKGVGSALMGSGLKTAAAEVGLGTVKSPFAGMLGSTAAEHAYDTIRDKDQNGQYTFDKNNYLRMAIGGFGFGLGSAASNTLRSNIAGNLTSRTNTLGDLLIDAINKGDIKLASNLESKLTNTNNILNSSLGKVILDTPSATNNKVTGAVLESLQGLGGGTAYAGAAMIDNNIFNGNLLKNHLLDLTLPIMQEKLHGVGKEASYWLKRKNQGNSTVGEMATNISNAIVGNSNPKRDFTGSYVQSKASVLKLAIRDGYQVPEGVPVALNKVLTLKELSHRRPLTSLELLLLQRALSIVNKHLNSMPSDLLEVAILNASKSNNNYNNALGHEGYVDLEHGSTVHNGIREGQRVLLDRTSSPEQIASALAGAYAGKRNGSGYMYGNFLGNFRGNKSLLSEEFMLGASGFNMNGEKVPLFIETPGGKYVVNKGAVTAGGRERQPVIGEDASNFVLNNISGYNMIPVNFGGKTYEFYMDTPGYGKTASSYLSSGLRLGATLGLGLDYYSRMHYLTGLREIPLSLYMFTNTQMNGRAGKVQPFERTITLGPKLFTIGIPVITGLLKRHNANIDYKHSLQGTLENLAKQSEVRVESLAKNDAMNRAFGTSYTVGNIGGDAFRPKSSSVGFTANLHRAMQDPTFAWNPELRNLYYDIAMKLNSLGIGKAMINERGKLTPYGELLSKLRHLSDAELSLMDGY